jgi:hypothetical protein
VPPRVDDGLVDDRRASGPEIDRRREQPPTRRVADVRAHRSLGIAPMRRASAHRRSESEGVPVGVDESSLVLAPRRVVAAVGTKFAITPRCRTLSTDDDAAG